MNYTQGGFPIWDDEFDREHFIVDEIAESDERVATIPLLIKAGNRWKQNADHIEKEKM